MSKGKDFDLLAEKAIEEVQLRNTKAIIEYSKKTRKMFEDIRQEFENVKKLTIQQGEEIRLLKMQNVQLLESIKNSYR